MPDLGIYALDFELQCHIWNQYPRICLIAKFYEKPEMLKTVHIFHAVNILLRISFSRYPKFMLKYFLLESRSHLRVNAVRNIFDTSLKIAKR